MSNPGKLREVLDTLSDDPARSLPRHDRELMESVLRRLQIHESRMQRPYERHEPEETELEAAKRRLAELEALEARHAADQEALRRIAAERDRLLDHQRELEERLARLEASSHGGPLSYVEQDEIVEFARVDLASGDEMLEFQYLGSERDQAFAPVDEQAWEEASEEGASWEEAPDESGAAWEEVPAAANERPSVDWDEAEAEPWQGGPEEAWEESPAGDAASAEETTSWEEPEPEDPFAESHEPAAAWQPDEPDDDVFNEDTSAELADLEKQLADLEREIAQREKREKPKNP